MVVALMYSKCLINFLNGCSSHACKVFGKVHSMVVTFMHVKCLVKCLNEWLNSFFFWFRNLAICLNMIINNHIMLMQILFSFFFKFKNLGISLNIVINKNIMLLQRFFENNSFQIYRDFILVLISCCGNDALFKTLLMN